MKFSSLAIPGSAPGFTVKAVVRGDIRDVRVTDYSGKYLIIIFYAEDYGCRDELIKFHEQIDKFEKLKCEVIACSSDSPQCHKSWINASSDDDGFSGNLSIPLLSDPSGGMSSLYDCFDEEEGICRNAVVIIDNSGIVRHSMGTTMSPNDVVNNCLDIIKILKKHGPVSDKERARDISPVHIDPEKVRSLGMEARQFESNFKIQYLYSKYKRHDILERGLPSLSREDKIRISRDERAAADRSRSAMRSYQQKMNSRTRSMSRSGHGCGYTTDFKNWSSTSTYVRCSQPAYQTRQARISSWHVL